MCEFLFLVRLREEGNIENQKTKYEKSRTFGWWSKDYFNVRSSLSPVWLIVAFSHRTKRVTRSLMKACTIWLVFMTRLSKKETGYEREKAGEDSSFITSNHSRLNFQEFCIRLTTFWCIGEVKTCSTLNWKTHWCIHVWTRLSRTSVKKHFNRNFAVSI